MATRTASTAAIPAHRYGGTTPADRAAAATDRGATTGGAPGPATSAGNVADTAAYASTTPQPMCPSCPPPAGLLAVRVRRAAICDGERSGRYDRNNAAAPAT